jgi:TolB protein
MSRTGQPNQPTRTARLGARFGVALLAAAGVVAAAPAANAADSAATASSPRTPIFFSSLRSGAFQIYKYDDNGVTRLTVANTYDRDPSVNRDRTLVAFGSTQGGLGALSHIDLMNANGSLRHTVVSDPGANLREPSLSPDGTKIVYTRQQGGDEQVYVVNTDGSGVRRLTSEGKSRMPAWSPDGAWIAFAHDVGSINEIFKMDSDGGRVERVTFQQYGLADPTWSPDGSKIAYSYRDLQTQDSEIFWTYAAGVNPPQQVTHHAGADTQPTWSPDGNTIVYTSTVDNKQELIATNTTGTNSYLVTAAGPDNSDADYGYPAGRRFPSPRPVDPPTNRA